MNDSRNAGEDQPDKHLEGKGHAHHQFNPDRAEEFRDPERLEALNLDRLSQELGLEETDQVLDLGTGSGALLPALSTTVSGGVVIGADISDEMLEMAHGYTNDHGLTNVVFLRNEPDQLTLHDETLDAVLIVSSLHEFSDPAPMLSEVHRVLKTGAPLGVLEWRAEPTPDGPPIDHRLDPETIRDWFTQAGFDELTVSEWNRQGYDLYTAVRSAWEST